MTAAPPPTTRTYWCELAVVGGAPVEGVTIDVADGRFTAVRPRTSAPPGSTRLGGVTLPGLANAHSHAFHRALRARTQADRGTFWTWRELMFAAAARLDPDRYRTLATAVFGEMALAGITGVGEFHYLHHRPDGTPYGDPTAMGDALLEAAAAAGIRITLLDVLYLHGGLDADGYRAPTGPQRGFADRSVDGWADRVERYRAGTGARIGAAIHSVRAVDPASMALVADRAAAACPLHAHVSEQVAENDACLAAHGRTPTAVLADAGALGPGFGAVHATHVTGADIDLLAAAGVTVVMCPTTERDLGDGIGPTGDFVAAGVPMALGSDSHATIDVLAEAAALELDERLRRHERGIHSAASLLASASGHGHRTLGWADAGAIAVGFRADLVAVRLGSVRTAGAAPSDALEAAVFAASAADVTDVIVDGRAVVTDGRHVSLDVATALHQSITDLMDG